MRCRGPHKQLPLGRNARGQETLKKASPDSVPGRRVLVDVDGFLTAVTGEPLSPKYLVAHLRERYLRQGEEISAQ